MSVDCLFDVLSLPEFALRRILQNSDWRAVSRMMATYPRVAGKLLEPIVKEIFTTEQRVGIDQEIQANPWPTPAEILEAEQELLRTANETLASIELN